MATGQARSAGWSHLRYSRWRARHRSPGWLLGGSPAPGHGLQPGRSVVCGIHPQSRLALHEAMTVLQRSLSPREPG